MQLSWKLDWVMWILNWQFFIFVLFYFLRSELVAKANTVFCTQCTGGCQVFFYRTKDQICQYFSFLSKIEYKCWIFSSGSLIETYFTKVCLLNFYVEYSFHEGMYIWKYIQREYSVDSFLWMFDKIHSVNKIKLKLNYSIAVLITIFTNYIM